MIKGDDKMVKKLIVVMVMALSLLSVNSYAASDWANSDNGLELTKAVDRETIAKTQILTAYGLNYWLHQMPLLVKVDEHTATIAGKVENLLQKNLALEIAKAAQGITIVVDNIQIDPNLEKKLAQVKFIQAVRDLNITTKIIDKIAKHADYNGHVEVTTYQGVVTLNGTVRNLQQKRQVEKIALQTTGVQQVINELMLNK